MTELAERFTKALHSLHADGSADGLVDMFDDDASLAKVGTQHTERGRDGARQFWTEYRDVFGDVEASFLVVLEDDHAATLEWESRGTLADGCPIAYRGVSVLESHDGLITAFRTYYDSAAFLERSSVR